MALDPDVQGVDVGYVGGKLEGPAGDRWCVVVWLLEGVETGWAGHDGREGGRMNSMKPEKRPLQD